MVAILVFSTVKFHLPSSGNALPVSFQSNHVSDKGVLQGHMDHVRFLVKCYDLGTYIYPVNT